jgi:hypothetical protein
VHASSILLSAKLISIAAPPALLSTLRVNYNALTEAVNTQLSLLNQTEPLRHGAPFGSYHYVPILKSLPGELKALAHTDADTWERMTPLIEATSKKGATEEPPDRSPLPSLASRLVSVLGTARPFYLDFRGLTSRSKILVRRGRERRPVAAIEHVLEDCRQRGLNFVPVVTPTKDAGRLALVRESLAAVGRRVCLRVPVAGVVRPTGRSLSNELHGLLEDLGTEAASTDLLLDLGYIGVEPGFDASHVRRILEEIPQLPAWRNVILSGTVIPQALSGYAEDDITDLARHEWRLWQELRQHDAPRLPTFGDYCVQHPERPDSSGPGMRANIRYTADEAVLIARGRSITEYGAGQYRDLCVLLSHRPEFRGSAYSWGDSSIAECAEGLGTPGGQEHWRGVGTSHHLRHVTESLGRISRLRV